LALQGGAFRAARIPIRTPAVAATDQARLAPEPAAGVAGGKSAKSIGVGFGNWLTLRQANALPNEDNVLSRRQKSDLDWGLAVQDTENNPEQAAVRQENQQLAVKVLQGMAPQGSRKS